MEPAEANHENEDSRIPEKEGASITHVAAAIQDAAKIVEHLGHEDRLKVIKALGLILGIELASPY